jgi:hypothetical protein
MLNAPIQRLLVIADALPLTTFAIDPQGHVSTAPDDDTASP